ncbi:MAG: hypothetical protein HFE76_14625 [Firmicutes bacterium]|nr:hypothetical protein [Bacillota bacterium]
MALGIQDYYQMKAELELLKTLAESEEDAVNGRVRLYRRLLLHLEKNF